MSDHSRIKRSKFRSKRPMLRRPSGHGGPRGGSNFGSKPPHPVPRRDYGYRTAQKTMPKEEKSHWNGKTEIWSEPQKPRQEKLIKYEVDTEKLLNELSRGNKENLKEIAEKLKEKAENNPEQASDLQDSDTLDKKNPHNEKAETKTNEPSETTEERNEPKETTEPQPDTNEKQEASPETETTTEAELQDSPIDAPELVFMKPSFWENLETTMSDELEHLEPEQNQEIPPEVGEPTNEESY